MNFETLTIEHYLLAFSALTGVILLIILLSQQRRIRRMKSEWLADRIDLEDASEKEKWFKLITQTIPKAFWIFEPKRTIYVSKAFTTLTGIHENEIREPSKLLDFLEPEFRSDCERKLGAFLSGETDRVQSRCRLIMKPETWFQFDYYRIHDQSETPYIVAMVEEITHQQKSLEELETDRDRLGLVLEYSDLSLFDWDLQTGEIQITGKLLKGSDSNAPGGRIPSGEWRSRIHPEDHETDDLLLSHCMEGKTPYYQNEIRFNTQMNEYRWILTRGEVSARDPENRPVRMAGIALDIHRRKQMEIQLRNNQILLKDILSSTDEGIFVLDKSFRVLFWNPQMEKISGKKRDEVSNQEPLFEHFPHLRTNGISAVIQETLTGNTTDGHVVPYNLESQQREGYTFEKYLPLKNNLGNIIGVIGFVRDITDELDRENEFEKTRERHELTVKAVNDGIWDWDLKKNQIVLSDRWFAQLGYEPGELSSSVETFRSLLDPLEAERIFDRFQEFFNEDTPLLLEYRMRHRNGDWAWIECRGSCIERSQDGSPIRALGTHCDISERKNSEQQMKEAMERAEESDRLKSSFLANMSHELRTPLNAIVGFSELISTEDLFPEEKETYIAQIRQNSESLLQLISDIIDLAKIESNRLEIHRENVSVARLIQEVAELKLQDQSREKFRYLEIKTEIPDELKTATIFTDPIRFRQILNNLTNNAIKFTEEGTVTIGVKVHKNNQLAFFVKDTGIGISKEDQEKIFRRFEQIDSGLNRKYGGTGLGLNITQNLVRLLGGRIWVTSDPGKGSTFLFTHNYE